MNYCSTQLRNHFKQEGFSLVEMAIVIVILGFVLGALLLPLQAQRQQLFQSQTENTLETAKRALLGYAQQNGRLPCPATATSNIDAGSNGQENPLGGTHNNTPPNPAVPSCAAQVGFLPAATLGLQPADNNGFVLDAWNNRIRYAIAVDDSSGRIPPTATVACGGDTAPDFTTSGNMSVVGLVCLAPELRICANSIGITATACSVSVTPETNYLTNNAVAVIYSTGATATQGVGGADETANLNDADANGIIDDGIFVSHDSRANDANGEFDHMVVWISPYILYNAMIEAGQLH
jgi:prepilin-type N-terminal cleavage/methylation domain-containing protein